MGMDVYGKNPASDKGEYFRANVWYWHPLWSYCEDTYTIAEKVEYGHSNDGDGLDENDSKELARLIRYDLERGYVAEYIANRNRELSELERPTCDLCEGTGIRSDEIGTQHGMPERELSVEMAMLTGRTTGWCNACDGEGKRDNWATHYHLTIESVSEFAEFLEDCGGFEIC